MFDFGCNGFGFGYGYGMFFTLLIWMLIIGLVVWFVTWLVSRNRHNAVTNAGSISAPASDTAIEILKQRYARGEISKAEYETMLDDLST